jgi:hypothetical protein
MESIPDGCRSQVSQGALCDGRQTASARNGRIGDGSLGLEGLGSAAMLVQRRVGFLSAAVRKILQASAFYRRVMSS